MTATMTIMVTDVLFIALGIPFPTGTETDLWSDIEASTCAGGHPSLPSPPGEAGVLADDGSRAAPASDEAQVVAAFAEWLRRFEAATSAVLPAHGTVRAAAAPAHGLRDLLAEGMNLAAARRPAVLRLLHENPSRALEQSIKLHEWVILPPEIRALVEEPFSEMGDLDVVPDCRPLPARHHPWQTHRVTMRGRTFHAFVYGHRQSMSSKCGVPLQGVLLDGRAVLWESPVLALAPESLAAARELFPDGNARDRSWWTGQVLGPEARVALCGGKLYHFASEEEVQALARVITEAEGLQGPNTVLHAFAAATGSDVFDAAAFERVAASTASIWTVTPKTVLAMRLDYTPARGTPFTQRELQTQLLTASNVIREMSYGKTWLIPTVTTVVLALPGSKEDYENGRDYGSDGRAAATAAGYDLADYDIYLYSFPERSGGNAWASGAHTFLGGRAAASTIVHELGHNYGLGHANSWLAMTGTGFLGHQNADGSLVEHQEYGDVFDLMGADWRSVEGGTPVWPHGHYSMSMKAYLNWIEDRQVLSVTRSGRYRIYRFDHKDAGSHPDHPLALRVDLREHGELWIGLRRNFVQNLSLSSGAYIVWTSLGSRHRLLDTTPLSQPNQREDMDKEDAALAPGQSYTDPSGTVRITNTGWGGTAPFEYLNLDVVLLDPTPAIELFTDLSCTRDGLLGRYVDQSLRDRPTPQNWAADRSIRIAGTRVDADLCFRTNGWGQRAPLHLTHGTDANWDDFSVQWDGVVVVNRPVRMATRSDDGSRMWIDLDGDGRFSNTSPEFIDNHWGSGQADTQGAISVTIAPGTYRVRIQYEEGYGDNTFALVTTEVQFEVFTDSDLVTPGLSGSYVNRNLRAYAAQDDWRLSQAISGSRIDAFPGFTTEDWGNRAALGLTGGTNENWDDFSVQWDGFLCVHQTTRFATISDDSSRMWIDLDGNGRFGFAARGSELIANHWGQGQSLTTGPVSTKVAPGTYQLRLQYEEGVVYNRFLLVGVPGEERD
jgi:hypothetical protein